MYELKIKRIYEPFVREDGYRILVDRLWPRGISKERDQIDLWAKEIAPSTKLRKEFHHDLLVMDEFASCYYKELEINDYSINFISLVRNKLSENNVTLLYAAKNELVNHVIILKEWLEKKLSENVE